MVNASLVTDELSGRGQDVVAWDNQNKLEFPIPFSDMKPEIYLGVNKMFDYNNSSLSLSLYLSLSLSLFLCLCLSVGLSVSLSFSFSR